MLLYSHRLPTCSYALAHSRRVSTPVWALKCGRAHQSHVRQLNKRSIRVGRQAAAPADRIQAADNRIARSPSGALPSLLSNCMLHYVHAALGAQLRQCTSVRGRRVSGADALSLTAARRAHQPVVGLGRVDLRRTLVCNTPLGVHVFTSFGCLPATFGRRQLPSSRARAWPAYCAWARVAARRPAAKPRSHRATRMQPGNGAARGLSVFARQDACVTVLSRRGGRGWWKRELCTAARLLFVFASHQFTVRMSTCATNSPALKLACCPVSGAAPSLAWRSAVRRHCCPPQVANAWPAEQPVTVSLAPASSGAQQTASLLPLCQTRRAKVRHLCDVRVRGPGWGAATAQRVRRASIRAAQRI